MTAPVAGRRRQVRVQVAEHRARQVTRQVSGPVRTGECPAHVDHERWLGATQLGEQGVGLDQGARVHAPLCQCPGVPHGSWRLVGPHWRGADGPMAVARGPPDTAHVTATPAPASGGHLLAVRDPAHGPLPALLLGLMLVAGAVDTVSVLKLGRVFVANMTGNIVFAGFAAVGTPGFPLGASILAVSGFLVGAWAGSRVGRRRSMDRARLLAEGATIELALFAAGTAFTLAVTDPSRGPAQYVLSAVLAFALGSQNAMVRRLGVPDLTTTVLTATLTGIAADLRTGRWHSPPSSGASPRSWPCWAGPPPRPPSCCTAPSRQASAWSPA